MGDKTKVFLAGVMDAYGYAGNQLLFTSKTLVDSSISFALTAEDIRGGKANALIAQYFHDSGMSLSMTDALFDLNYLALKVGQSINADSTSGALAEEQVEVAVNGQITVSGIPADFMTYGKCGWIAKPGSESWNVFDFTDGATATGVTFADGSTPMAGDICCVKYMNEVVCDELIIPSEFVPGEITLVLKGNLYRAGVSQDIATSSIIGTLEVEIPRFQVSAEGDLSLTSSGASQTALSGQALRSEAGNSCESSGTYAIVKDIRIGTHWYDNLIQLAIEGPTTISLTTGATKAVKTFGIFSNGTSRLIEPAKLTYSFEEGTATGTTMDGATGVITAGTTPGDGSLTITVAEKPGIEVIATVAVVTA